ncbi:MULTISPECIES: hypothetical protein [Mycolicibacterium]|uniref:Uncharacterized protein n=1 Tax=Mycolicibacterium nivoides TaxID=2487344 RepID=A0ABW9LN66_9MYCO|nr:hypothetical protein [Mycolicibacterium fortuitum]UBV13415.1 hypothetical protein H8Z57_21575 [Mycolicibacterium fortuitum]
MSLFGDAVSAAADGTSYKVSPTKRGFDVELDIVNAHWWERRGRCRFTGVEGVVPSG